MKHRLLLYRQLSWRLRGIAFLLLLIVILIGLYDLLVHPFLGNNWFWWWAVAGLLFLLWIYYALLVPRTALHIRRDHVRLQGPIRGVNVGYDSIRSVTSTHLTHHHPFDSLRRAEKTLVEPLKGKTAVLIELDDASGALRTGRLWFHRLIFSSTRPGLVLLVDDWIALSQSVEVARDNWRARRQAESRGDTRSLAARVLSADD